MGIMMVLLSRLIFILVIIFIFVILVKYFRSEAQQNAVPTITDVQTVFARIKSLNTSNNSDTNAALMEFNELLRVVKTFIPQSMFNQLLNIGYVCADLNNKFNYRTVAGDEKALVFFTMANYIPSILKSYLLLPAAERIDNSEATQIVTSQMLTILGTLSSFQQVETQRIINDLKVHALFVEDKFKDYK